MLPDAYRCQCCLLCCEIDQRAAQPLWPDGCAHLPACAAVPQKFHDMLCGCPSVSMSVDLHVQQSACSLSSVSNSTSTVGPTLACRSRIWPSGIQPSWWVCSERLWYWWYYLHWPVCHSDLQHHTSCPAGGHICNSNDWSSCCYSWC